MAVEPEWVVDTPDGATVRRLASELGCPEPVASVLASRGRADPEAARRFLNPSPSDIHHPSSLPDVETAVERIGRAIDGGESVAVFADRDVDGACGAAVLVWLLRDLGADVAYEVPGKWDGYGLNDDAVDDLAAGGTDLLVTVDCGTTAIAELERARAAGVDAVVTDHHEPEDGLPPVAACINPRRPDSAYPNAALAGGAVAFKLGQVIVESRVPARIEDYHGYALPLAAVATLGDYMPLNMENRAIAREGFDRLFDAGPTGLVEPARHVGVEAVRDIPWSLVPLLNGGQEDEDGELMLELLLAEDRDRCVSLIDQLATYREQRRADRRERIEHLRARIESLDEPAGRDLLVVEADRYVGGGAMTQLAEEWGKPVIAYRAHDGAYRGDGRSRGDVDFLDLFGACAEHLQDYWGHPGAAGFVVDDADLEPFTDRLRKLFRERYDPADLRPTVEIEGRLEPDDLDRSLQKAVARLGPFGTDNPDPEFLLEGIEIERCDVFGTEDRHCKLRPAVTDAFTVIAWDGAETFADLDLPGVFDIVGTIGYDVVASKPALTVTDHRRAADA